MKYLTGFIIVALFVQCSKPKDPDMGIIEYLKWDNDTNYNYREFQSITDTTMTRIFIAQTWEIVDDSTWQFEYVWTNIDSMPINKSIERYTKNRVDLIAQYIYELESSQKTIEIPFQLGDVRSCSINSGACNFEAKAKFVKDTAFTMLLNVEMEYQFKILDSLPEDKRDCVVVNSKDKISFEFSDNRTDTVIYTQGTRIYSKGIGLIYFSDDDGKNKVEYNLKKD